MHILLIAINAKYIHSNPAVFSLKSCTGKYSSYVAVVEFTINQQPSFVLQEIYKRRPDVIAFSCYIWNRTFIDQIIYDIPKVLPDTDIWAGGPEVSFHTSDILKQWPLRGIMTGPGEEYFSRLVSAYVQDSADQLPAVLDAKNAPLRTLDEIPFWYEDLSDFEHRIIYYESSRGCPFSCSYCLSAIDRTMDFRSVQRVCLELDFFLKKNVPQVKFIDRTFNCSKKHALPILHYLLSHDNGITNFHFEIAADLLDEDYFKILKKMRPGAVQLEIGVQSTHKQTIAAICREMDFQKVSDAVQRIRAWHNIHIHLDLIAGLPYEDLQIFQSSFNDVYRLQPQQLQLGFLKVLKGSVMEAHALEYSLAYTNMPPYEVLSTKWLTYEDICRLKQIEEVLEIYYNSGQFAHTLAFLHPYFDTPFALYDSLASWYETHHLFGIQSSRIRKYEILLEFGTACMMSFDSCKTAQTTIESSQICALKETLTYDLYLREHIKNRPSFAHSLEHWKQEIDGLLKEEAKTHAFYPELKHCSYRELTKALHIEVFETIFDHPTALLFGYTRRDPLTNNGTVKKIVCCDNHSWFVDNSIDFAL